MIVVDANIILYRLVGGPRQADAQALVRAEPGWSAPVLWRSEVRNALSTQIRAGRLASHDAARAMLVAVSFLTSGEHVVPDRAVFDLVSRSKCSAYDCEHIALADAQNAILVTEDVALRRAFPKQCRSISQMI